MFDMFILEMKIVVKNEGDMLLLETWELLTF